MLYARLEQALAARGVTRGEATRLLVACSGGPDSVALAHVATKLYGPGRVALGHVDHGVRADSGEDADAARALAARLHVEVYVARLDGVADDEASLRAARYAALERMRASTGAAWVLTAHSADDQAETILLALLSRTHADALRGMPVERGAVLRPWLEVPRAELHAHVRRHRLPARLDTTNLEPRYLRNRLRKELLPLIEARYRPGFARRLATLAAALQAEGGGDADGSGGASAALASRAPSSPPDPPVAEPGPPLWFRRSPWAGGSIPDGRDRALFDADAVQGIRVRALAVGDRIRPYGRRSPRKVRDVLREAGIREAERRLWQVVTDDADRVLWVPGCARSNHAPVGEKTKFVWVCGVDRNDELRGGASRANLDGADPGAHVPDREKNE